MKLARRSGPDKQSLVRRAALLAWAGPTTLAGLGLAVLAGPGARWRRGPGGLEVSGGWLPALLRWAPIPGGAAAVALGHAILARDQAALDRHREHELVHVRQAERWGPLFLPAYLLAGAWQLVKGRHPYHDNPFEAEAWRAG